MKKFITNILIIIAVGCAGALVAWCVTHDEQTELFSEQETTLRTFFSALSQGDWATAGSVCDSTKMTGYIDNYREAWNSAKAKDTSVLNLAASELAKSEIFFIEQNMTSEESSNAVFTISLGEKFNKTRRAELKLQDGKWIITGIKAEN